MELVATAGLVMFARSLTKKKEEYTPPPPTPVENDYHRTTVVDTFTGGVGGVGMNPYGKVEQPSFGEVAFMKHVNGEPVRDFRDRPYVSGKMNNLSPTEKNLVGPGLNVGADVPAYGGYQQLFRVKPNNVGAYKLTTLPGRSGPAADVTGGRGQIIGELNHKKPETTAFLPSRLPNTAGKAQGQGGSLNAVVPRGEYQRTKRTTNRSETTLRADGLEFAPAKKFVSASTLAEDPTRNKGDINVLQYSHVNNPTPGIYSFHGAYTNTPELEMLKKYGHTNDPNVQNEYGVRPSDRRGNPDRLGNGGRMNVRGDPLNQGGMVTAVRSDCSRIDGRTNGAGPTGTNQQMYVQPMYQNNNAYKGNYNPRASNQFLSTAVNQLSNNPLALSLAS